MKLQPNRFPFRSLCIAGLIALAPTVAPLAAEEWKFSVSPYVWLTDIGIDVAIADRTVVDEEFAVEDLLEDLDTIAQVRFEAQKGAHGAWVDLFDVTLSDDAATVALPNGTATLRPEMGMTLLEVGGLYDQGGDQEGFQLFYGARVLNQRAEIDGRFELGGSPVVERTYEIDDTLVDGLVGFRYVRRLGERWSISGKADVSSGGTELTWSVNPSVGYSFGENGRYTVSAGYRTLVVEFDTDDALDVEMTLSGFYTGFRFAF